jgi:hypothetical protein
MTWRVPKKCSDEITSHLYSFGLRGKQFQYIEGTLPRGLSFHGPP